MRHLVNLFLDLDFPPITSKLRMQFSSIEVMAINMLLLKNLIL
jgi:hypothetical protein